MSDEANDLSNLGVAQKRAGLWREAMASYDASLLVWCEGEDSQEAVLGEGKVCASNRQTLVREVRHWTGTALEFELDDDAEDQVRSCTHPHPHSHPQTQTERESNRERARESASERASERASTQGSE